MPIIVSRAVWNTFSFVGWHLNGDLNLRLDLIPLLKNTSSLLPKKTPKNTRLPIWTPTNTTSIPTLLLWGVPPPGLNIDGFFWIRCFEYKAVQHNLRLMGFVSSNHQFHRFESRLKVTVHIGTDQNFEIEILAEYKFTLNKLLVKKNVFQYV